VSLRTQLLAALVVPTALVLAVLAFVAERTAFRALEASLGRRLTTVAASATTFVSPRLAALGPRDGSSRTARNALRKLTELKDQTGVARILMVDVNRDRVLVDTARRLPAGAAYVRARFDAFELEAVRAGGTAASVLFEGEDGQPVKTGYAPLSDGERVVAYAAVQAAPEYGDALARQRSRLIWGAAVSLAILVALAFGVARWVSVPLARLARAAGRIGAGDLDARVAEEGPTEARVLARTMNGMASALRSRDARMQMMLAGIAHEVRNPLGGIELFGGMLKEDLPPDDPKSRHVDRILAEMKNLSGVVNDFLDYARQRELDLTWVDLVELARRTWDLVEGEARTKAIQVEWTTRPTRHPVDSDAIRRALLNLMRNAVQACPGEGRVRVGIEPLPGTGALLWVEDSGPGVSEVDADRIFEPFFTTKQQGTGLGLALVAKAAELHGGAARCARSRDLSGARFELRLGG
jgi:signal transduction histidine kinase